MKAFAMGRRRHYEPLLGNDELRKKQLQNRLLHKSWWILAVVTIVTLLAFSMSPSNSNESNNKEQHKHVIPTLLSVVHHETGEYLLALENPVYEKLKRSLFVSNHNSAHLANSFLQSPTIHVHQSEIGVRDPLSLSWTAGRDTAGRPVLKDDDLIVLYCDDYSTQFEFGPTNFVDAATIAQARTTSQKQHRALKMNPQTWHFPSFPVLRQDSCQFSLLKELPNSNDGQPIYARLDTSTFRIKSSRTVPTAIHLAFGDTPSEMVVQFVTGDKDGKPIGDKEGTPVARYIKQGSKKDSDAKKVSGTSHTYAATDLCEAPANLTEAGKFQSPGMIHVVRLKDLEPNTAYEYKVGVTHGQGITWSESYSFTSAPVTGDETPHSFLVYGDQGCPSNGWGDGATWTAAMTTREVLDPKDKAMPIRSIHHFGDLSYARGAAHVWDEWFNMISNFTSKVPLMIAVGNHEYDHLSGGANGKDPSGVLSDDGYRPLWGNYHNDSGGECGVPTANHFTMPNSTTSNGVFWYSYNFGNVHTTVISSEHDISPGSVQHQWLESDFASVDRTVTPWLILEAHRPIYESENHWDDNAVGIARRQHLDDLLVDHKVDLVLAGHYHAYLRTCDGLYNSKCHNGGPTHITVGSAGAILDDAFLYDNHWTEKFIKQEFGYGRITVANASALHFEFVKAGASNDTAAGEVHDDVWLIRER